MAKSKISIDNLIKIVSNGGRVKTGIDVYNKNNILLLEKNVLVDSVAILENIKRSGVKTLPIFPDNAGGLWDKDGNSIELEKPPGALETADSFEAIPAASINVEKKLKEISQLKHEASVNYKKAKNNIKKILTDIKDSGGEFDYTAVEDTVTDLVSFLSANDNGFSYLTKEIFSYDDYLHNHCVNVCTIGTAIITKFNKLFSNDKQIEGMTQLTNLNESELQEIAAGLFLHDIGKVMIPDAILNKKGKLTDEEFSIVRKHSYEKAPEILKKNNISSSIIHNIAMFHHANLFDGEKSCYPGNIAAGNLPLYVKVSKLADIYDAMTSKRCYKEAFNPINVVTDIFRKYAQKDETLQGILYAFVKSIGIYPPGSVVKLLNGQYAYIIDSQGPIVVPITSENGETLYSQQPAANLTEDKSLSVDTEFPLISPVDAYDLLPDYLKNITFTDPANH